jgi:hypothetical protein
LQLHGMKLPPIFSPFGELLTRFTNFTASQKSRLLRGHYFFKDAVNLLRHLQLDFAADRSEQAASRRSPKNQPASPELFADFQFSQIGLIRPVRDYARLRGKDRLL